MWSRLLSECYDLHGALVCTTEQFMVNIFYSKYSPVRVQDGSGRVGVGNHLRRSCANPPRRAKHREQLKITNVCKKKKKCSPFPRMLLSERSLRLKKKNLFYFLGVTHNKKKKKGSVVKTDLLESPDGFRNRFDVSYWSFQVWLAIKCIVEGASLRRQTDCGTRGVAAQSKRCEFFICTPPCVTACGEGDYSVCCN